MVLSATGSSLVCRLRERHAQRLEDRLEHVLRIGAVQQSHVQGQPGTLRKPLEEAPRDVGTEPADARLREIDVRNDERLIRDLQHDARKRLCRRHRREPKTRSAVGTQRFGECAAERAARLRHLGFGGAGLDLEGKVEPRIVSQPFEQSVEYGQAGLDARGALSVQFHANPASARRGHSESGGYRSPRGTEDGPVGPCSPDSGLRYSNDVTFPGALFAAVVLAPVQPVTIAVIDTGADLRVPEIAASQPLTYDVRTGGRDVRDLNGHGTRVATLVARTSGNARLLIIRAGSASGAFSDAGEAAAIRYAVDAGARIINLSLGGSRTSNIERSAVNYAIRRGALIVAAAGDDYANRPEYPAALLGRNGLAVAAVTNSGARAPFSNTGPWLSVAAFGDGGTSFAAPIVAGAAALVLEASPRLSARQIVQILEATASGQGTHTNDLGFGVVEPALAVARARYGR
jgi:hypothetical protein